MRERGAIAGVLIALGGCAAPAASTQSAPEPAANGEATLQSTGDEAEPIAVPAALDQAASSAPQAAPEPVELSGEFTQGGLIFGKTAPGAQVSLDAKPIMISPDGRFVFGFGRDEGAKAVLAVTLPDGTAIRREIAVADREFPVDRIDGLDQSKVSGFTKEQLTKIAIDTAKKKAAREKTDAAPYWAGGFAWPVIGRISGVFGSQRILNGEAKTPHSGVDVAAPAGTPIMAPAEGVIRLAESDMYFEGGLVLIDHGQWLESGFLHLSRLDVKPGDRVARGQIIGAVGATGRATGPHMHWSLRWAGTLVDPALVAGEMPPQVADAGG